MGPRMRVPNLTGAGCRAPEPAPRVKCPCGENYCVRVVVEYIQDGHVDYAGGRFCYVATAKIDIEIPDDAEVIQAMVYDMHQPDEFIRITFTPRFIPRPRDAEGAPDDDDVPGSEVRQLGPYRM